MIADANGLSASDTLIAGRDLLIPNKVHNSHNTSDVYRVYDPNEAIGNTSPTMPKPPKHSSGCGVMGQILTVIVAVVVSYFFGPVIGDVAKQLTAMALGDQSQFNWKEVGVTAAATLLVGPGGGGSLLQTVVHAVAFNAVTQGLNLAVGLQKKFDWTGLAAAAVTAGVMRAVNPNINLGNATVNGMANSLVSGMAGAFAGAATRTLIDGSDFGDNLMAVLPDVIGNTIGNMVADGISGLTSDTQDQPEAGENGGKVGNSDGGEGTHFTDVVGGASDSISGRTNVRYIGTGLSDDLLNDAVYQFADNTTETSPVLVQVGDAKVMADPLTMNWLADTDIPTYIDASLSDKQRANAVAYLQAAAQMTTSMNEDGILPENSIKALSALGSITITRENSGYHAENNSFNINIYELEDTWRSGSGFPGGGAAAIASIVIHDAWHGIQNVLLQLPRNKYPGDPHSFPAHLRDAAVADYNKIVVSSERGAMKVQMEFLEQVPFWTHGPMMVAKEGIASLIRPLQTITNEELIARTWRNLGSDTQQHQLGH